jgi:dolichyl-phosphate-mannose--protein O-mannosyl transferase
VDYRATYPGIDDDPQMYGVAPTPIDTEVYAEDPYLTQSPEDYWRWAQRGREVLYDRDRGTSMGVWREQEQIDRQYWSAIQEEQRKINFRRRWGI